MEDFMVPQEKRAAVTRGLREAFGVTEFEEIRELNGGRGANPVFLIVVRGSRFLLRINLCAGDLTPLHMHEGGGRSRPGAACLVHQR